MVKGTKTIAQYMICKWINDNFIDGLIVRNPADKIGRELKRNDKKPKEREALTEEQQAVFIEYIKQNTIYRHYLPFFSFLLATGCRVGDAYGKIRLKL